MQGHKDALAVFQDEADNGQDASLKKTFGLWPEKGVNLKLQADAFNVLNHPSFSSPGNNSSTDDITTPGTFGQLTGTSNSARVVQLVLRLEF